MANAEGTNHDENQEEEEEEEIVIGGNGHVGNGTHHNNNNDHHHYHMNNENGHGGAMMMVNGHHHVGNNENGEQEEEGGGMGYTPLEELGGGYVAFGIGPEGDNDGEEEDGATFVFSMNPTAAQDSTSTVGVPFAQFDVSASENGGGRGGGAFFVNPISAQDRNASAADGDGDDQMDFRALADGAIRALDEEYASTIRSEQQQQQQQPATNDDEEAVDEEQTEENEGFASDQTQAVLEEDLFANFDSSSQMNTAPSDHMATTTSVDNDTTTTTSPQPPRKLPPVDFEAVQRAMNSIRLKSPTLAATLDDWDPSAKERKILSAATSAAMINTLDNTVLPTEHHPIIPSAPLAAFRRRTSKAVRATSNLSRSATLAEAISRAHHQHHQQLTNTQHQHANKHSLPFETEITIHLLGVDSIECQSENMVKLALGPFVRWIGAASSSFSNIKTIHFTLVGPNIPPSLLSETSSENNEIDLLPPSPNFLEYATATFACMTYHEYLDQSIIPQHHPALIIAFNAGIWGYDEWKPTLRRMCHLPQPSFFVSTAYTLEEAEDDAQVIRDIVVKECFGGNDADFEDYEASSSSRMKQWGPERNPFASRQARQTHTAPKGRIYRENAAWQAWILGGGKTDQDLLK